MEADDSRANTAVFSGLVRASKTGVVHPPTKPMSQGRENSIQYLKENSEVAALIDGTIPDKAIAVPPATTEDGEIVETEEAVAEAAGG